MKHFYVYILTNSPRGTLYIGVTSNLAKRLFEHREGLVRGFTQKYALTRLVYVQPCASAHQAISLEKQLKRWHRDWKINLVEEKNPQWIDLYNTIILGMDPETSSG